MLERYRMRPQRGAYSVYDVWTGRTVVIAGLPQDDLARTDAAELAALLNRRARAGERDLRQ